MYISRTQIFAALDELFYDSFHFRITREGVKFSFKSSKNRELFLCKRNSMIDRRLNIQVLMMYCKHHHIINMALTLLQLV